MKSASESLGVLEWTRRPLLWMLVLCVISLFAFAGGLLVTESVGEVGTDIDFKPFFIPYLFIVITRFGPPTLLIGLGAAIGEGILDIFEGYEIDDPVGFVGYVLGFVLFGWYLHEVADDPTSWRALTGAALLGAFVQAFFEAFAYFVFDPSAGGTQAGLSLLGNTLSHGFLLGAVPLVLLAPAVQDYLATRQAM
ncbi:hypothetical protein [Salinigranum halophilum]|uniref:hypothetical protein n=1 Tax=Salinigranum halophilum TaxID=2565931 RepID=UPI0010A89285|nr:hypothetical protein [Salinigranum halophilum]